MSNLSQFMHGGAPRYYEEITVSKTWTKPAGITTFFVEVSGGSGGDGDGLYTASLFDSSSLSNSVGITIGAKGSISYSPASTYYPESMTASQGGTSSFGGYLSSETGYRSGVGSFGAGAGGKVVGGFSGGFVRITGW